MVSWEEMIDDLSDVVLPDNLLEKVVVAAAVGMIP